MRAAEPELVGWLRQGFRDFQEPRRRCQPIQAQRDLFRLCQAYSFGSSSSTRYHSNSMDLGDLWSTGQEWCGRGSPKIVFNPARSL